MESRGGTRVLALDIGLRRIGLAVVDSLGLTALGLDTLQRRTLRQDVARIIHIAKERKVEFFLVGLPLHMSGDESEMSSLVRKFAARLEADSGLPVRLQDERLTSVEAEDRLREQGLSLDRMLDAKRQGAVDRLAAVVLLEDYLRQFQPAE